MHIFQELKTLISHIYFKTIVIDNLHLFRKWRGFSPLLSDVVKDVGTSNVWKFIFPVCSIGIYFSSALERVYFSLFMCGNLFFPICSLGIFFLCFCETMLFI